MHDPLCVSIESLNVGRGAGTLDREQILGAFAATQHQHSVGYDLLLLKFRNDPSAGNRIKTAIRDWACKHSHLQYRVESCLLALNLITQLPLPNQISRSATLIRRYSPKANQYRRNITELHEQIKNEEGERFPDEVRISELEGMVKFEKTNFKAWSIQEAHKASNCQMCRGTGCSTKPIYKLCGECSGSGRVLPTKKDILLSLHNMGAVIPNSDWLQLYSPLLNQLLNWLLLEESEATDTISKRLMEEREDDEEARRNVVWKYSN